jgi:hypothetical protein
MDHSLCVCFILHQKYSLSLLINSVNCEKNIYSSHKPSVDLEPGVDTGPEQTQLSGRTTNHVKCYIPSNVWQHILTVTRAHR